MKILLTLQLPDDVAHIPMLRRVRVPDPGTERRNDGLGFDTFGGERFGGWGLPMVETLADTVEYLPANPHGTVVRASRRIAVSTL